MLKNKYKKIVEDETLIQIVSKDRFIHGFLSSKKYKNLFFSKEAAISLIISLVTSRLLYHSYNFNKENTLALVSNLLPMIITSLVILLVGVLISATIVTANRKDNFVQILVRQDKIQYLFNILFSFYFTAFLLATSIVLLTSVYILNYSLLHLNFNVSFTKNVFVVVSLLLAYLVLYSIISTTTLIGTQLRLFFVRFLIESKDSWEKEESQLEEKMKVDCEIEKKNKCERKGEVN